MYIYTYVPNVCVPTTSALVPQEIDLQLYHVVLHPIGKIQIGTRSTQGVQLLLWLEHLKRLQTFWKKSEKSSTN